MIACKVKPLTSKKKNDYCQAKLYYGLTGLLDIPYNAYYQDFVPIRAAPIGA